MRRISMSSLPVFTSAMQNVRNFWACCQLSSQLISLTSGCRRSIVNCFVCGKLKSASVWLIRTSIASWQTRYVNIKLFCCAVTCAIASSPAYLRVCRLPFVSRWSFFIISLTGKMCPSWLIPVRVHLTEVSDLTWTLKSFYIKFIIIITVNPME